MDEQSGQRDRKQRAPRWPRNEQRDRVLRLVREHGRAVDATALAERMGLHVTTVRFHLDALCEEGAVARTRIKGTGVGRPRTGYIAVRDRLDYRSLVEVLALELGDTAAERRQRAERAGERWASRIMADEPGEPAQSSAADSAAATVGDRAAMIATVFDRMGFDAELTSTTCSDGRPERTIRLYGCPVRDLARTHPEVSCAMHLGLLRGLLRAGTDDKTGAGLRAELDPFAEPEMCVARLICDP